MLKIIGCITVLHDLRLVALAGLVCLLSCVISLLLMACARHAQGWAKAGWVAASGSVAGCGVWATHFVAMLAYQNTLSISYDVALTFVSFAVAVVLSNGAVSIAVYARRPELGGACFGLAVAVMHYTGMSALRGQFSLAWEAEYVALSVLAGMVLGVIAFSLAQQQSYGRAIVSAGVLTVAICVLHFTGMTAVTLTPVASTELPGAAFENGTLAIAIAALQMLITGIGLLALVLDSERRLRGHISALQQTKHELEQSEAKLKLAVVAANQSNAAKSQFLSNMSHELRTPLNAVLGYSELISKEPYGPLGDARYLDYVCDINASGSHLLSLINDILDLARLESGQFELEDGAVDVAELVGDALRNVRPQAAQGQLAIVCQLPQNLPTLRLDYRRFKQVLLNLLSNAVKFTPPGGSVTIGALNDVRSFKLWVRDSGIGMNDAEILVALDRFGQVESSQSRKHQGTGLGLPISKELMELLGGSLSITSEPGKGTCITLEIPAERILGEQHARQRAAIA